MHIALKVVLDILRDRLEENGNTEASKQLDELKDRYHSITGIVGVASSVELFEEDKVEQSFNNLHMANSVMEQANKLLLDTETQQS